MAMEATITDEVADDLDWVDLFTDGFSPRVVAATVTDVSPDIVRARFAAADGSTSVGVLACSDWLPGDEWTPGMQVVAAQMDDTARPRLSRTDPALVTAVLDGLSPQVRTGMVRVIAVARDPGRRTKVAVAATVAGVDPVAACVGRAHVRVDALRDALGGEQVDVVAWHPDRLRFLANAMQPADVVAVWFDDATGMALTVAPDHQMAAAVGAFGLNSLLAARLVDVKVRVVPKSKAAGLVRKFGPPQFPTTMVAADPAGGNSTGG